MVPIPSVSRFIARAGRRHAVGHGRWTAVLVTLVVAVPHAGDLAAQDARSPLEMRIAHSGGPTTYAITQDKAGFVWLGTHRGLAWTDGHEFRETPLGPNGTAVTALTTDRDGRIWAGTAAGLFRLDPATGEVEAFHHDPAEPGSLSNDWITTIFADDQGRIWVGALDWGPSEGGGLNLFDPATGTFRRFLHDPRDPESLSHDRVRSITQTPDGDIWIGTWYGLNRLDPTSGRVRRWLHDPGDPGSLAYDDVKTLLPTRDGRLWVGTLGGGLDLLDPRTGVFEHRVHDSGDVTSLPSDYVMALLQDPLQRLWIGTMDGGLAILDTVDGSLRRVVSGVDLDDRGRLGRIEALYLTDDDVLWVAGYHPMFYTPLLATVDVRTPRIDVLPTGRLAVAVAEESPGVAWALLAGGRLLRWDRNRGEVREARCMRPGAEELPMIDAGALRRAPDGTLWVSTWGAGLCRIEPGAAVRPFQPADGASIPPFLLGLAIDASGGLWLADANGVRLVDPATGRIRGTPAGRASEGTRLLGGRPGTTESDIWMETPAGLARIDTSEVGPRQYRLSDPAQGPRVFGVRGIARDTSGTMWAAAEVGGLCRLDPIVSDCRPVDQSVGGGHVSGVYADRRGRLWVTTHYDLVEVDPASGTEHVIALPDPEHRYFQPGAGVVGSTGEIYLGGSDDVIAFDPARMEGNTHPPIVYVTGVNTGEASDHPPDGPWAFPSTAPDARLRRAHDDNTVVFRFTAVQYARPERIRYQYRLVGLEDAFHEAGGLGEATYTHLPPGDYQFQVRAVSAAGIQSATDATVNLHIVAAWWDTAWAYAAYALLLGGLLLWYLTVVKNRARLAASLEVKSAEAARLQDLDNAKSRFFANISHEFRTPLTLILGQLRSVLDSPERSGNEERLRMAERSAERVGHMVDQILDLSKLEAGTMTLDAEVRDVVPLVRLRVASFQSLAESRGVGLSLAVQRAEIAVRHDPEKLEMILDNLLSNALKFTHAGDSVRVTLRVVDRALDPEPLMEMEVADTGIGIPPEHLSRIFERFYRVEGPERPDGTGAGIGLALTRELVNLHEGDIDVTSEEGIGTRFLVRLPLARVGPVGPVAPPAGNEREDAAVPFQPPPAGTVAGPVAEPGLGEDQDAVTDDRPLVLIIEDNADLRTFLRDHLEPEYRIVEASDGEAGLALALDTVPDLVLTDVMMPKLDGYEVSRRLREDTRTSHVPIVMLTAKASEASRVEGLETGVDDYLLKPFSQRVLLTRLRSLIELRRILREKYAGETWIRPEEVEAGSVDRAFLESLTTTIEENLGDREFGVERLAAAMHMSSSQLTRKLRALIDQSPGRLIRAMRLHRAAELIRKDGGNLSRIALLTGFSDHAHFSRSFKQQFDCTPSEYRDRQPGIQPPEADRPE